MGVSRLTGTPWHVEQFTRKDGDDRRHRTRCVYYQKSDAHCSLYSERCRGSAHCSYYREIDPDEGKAEPVLWAKKVKNTTHREGNYHFSIGSRVTHKSYGTGTVKKIANGRITVAFDSGQEKILGLDICVKNKLILPCE